MKNSSKVIIIALVFTLCISVLSGCGKSEVQSSSKILAKDSTTNNSAAKNSDINNTPTNNGAINNTPTNNSAKNNSTSNNSVKNDTPANNFTPKNSNSAVASNNNPSKDEQNSTRQGTIPKSGNVILKELAVKYNGNTLAINDTVDDNKIESMFGKALEKKSHTYSANDGLNMDMLEGMTEKEYKYSGLIIKALNSLAEKNVFYVFTIDITDTRYSTPRNIKVGDSVEKLHGTYKDEKWAKSEEGAEDTIQYNPVNYVDGIVFNIKANKISKIHIYHLTD